MATKRQRYMISVNDEMFKKIENFRYKKRFPTCSTATTELTKLELEALKKQGILSNNQSEKNEGKNKLIC